MNWAYRAILGPSLWAIAFAVIYSLHGYGCARGWQWVEVSGTTLHHLSMLVSYVVAVLAGIVVFILGRSSHGNFLVRMGDLIGLGAIVLTLWPAIGLSSC